MRTIIIIIIITVPDAPHERAGELPPGVAYVRKLWQLPPHGERWARSQGSSDFSML
jgi:hypothetical protein